MYFCKSAMSRTSALGAPTSPTILLHFNGGLTNSGTLGATFTTVGTPTYNSTIRKFGASAIEFNGISYVYTPKSYIFGTSDFTLETWVYWTGTINNYPAIIDNRITTDAWAAGEWAVQLNHVSYPNKFSFGCYNYNQMSHLLVGTTNAVLNTWYHVAVTRSGTTFRLFVNGVLEATATGISISVDGGIANCITVGAGDSAGTYFKGLVDETRIVIGQALYTSNFSVQTQEY